MFKIGEFSRLGQVSTRMLRHYNKLEPLVPSHTDKWTGYRYYTLDQLSRLHRIIALKELDFSLQDIADMLQNEADFSVAELRGMLLLKQAEVRRELGWVAAYQHVPVGPLRELHLSGPAHANGVADEDLVTELQLPIAPATETS